MYKLIALLASLIVLTNCTPRYIPTGEELDDEEITWIAQQVAVKFQHECFLRVEHARVLFDSCGFTRLGFQFSTQDILEVKDARALLVDLVEFTLGEINRDPLLCGQLCQYPFTADNLDIIILCESFLPEYIDPYYVGCIKLKNGFAYYYAADEKDQNLYSWHSRVEPYAKSREFVMLGRAAEKEYDKYHLKKKQTIPDQFVPDSE